MRFMVDAHGQTKQPYCFEVNEGALFVFAGIRDRWKAITFFPVFMKHGMHRRR
jgi:putative SOS response-associated peptidase YedK